MAQRGIKRDSVNNDAPMNEEISEDESGEENEEEEEEEEENEVDDGEEESVFRRSLKMPPYEHAKRKLSQLIGMLAQCLNRVKSARD